MHPPVPGGPKLSQLHSPSSSPSSDSLLHPQISFPVDLTGPHTSIRRNIHLNHRPSSTYRIASRLTSTERNHLHLHLLFVLRTNCGMTVVRVAESLPVCFTHVGCAHDVYDKMKN